MLSENFNQTGMMLFVFLASNIIAVCKTAQAGFQVCVQHVELAVLHKLLSQQALMHWRTRCVML